MIENDRSVSTISGDFVAIKALENGVTVIGLTRGSENKFLHTEKLDKGEVWISQFTEHISAIKVRGVAKILTKYGELESGN
ncbi:MAG: trp RNA-binding attenuation protein MtrB [Synergistaceae bacterium]